MLPIDVHIFLKPQRHVAGTICTCAGGELVDSNDLRWLTMVIRYERYVALAICVMLLLLPCVYLLDSR